MSVGDVTAQLRKLADMIEEDVRAGRLVDSEVTFTAAVDYSDDPRALAFPAISFPKVASARREEWRITVKRIAP